MAAAKSLKLSRVGEQIKVMDGATLLGFVARSKEGIAFVGKHRVAAAFAAVTLGGAIAMNWDDPSVLEDLHLLFAALIADQEIGGQLSKAAALMKQFDPLDLIGSPRFVCEEVMQRCPSLEVEQVFALLSRVRDTVETDGAGGLWFVVGCGGGEPKRPVLSLCGRMLSEEDGHLIPEHGVMLELHPGTDSVKVARLSTLGALLIDVLEHAQDDAGILLSPIDSAQMSKHPSGGEDGTTSLQNLLVSQVFTAEGDPDGAVAVQFVTNGTTLAIITANFFPVGKDVKLLRYKELEESLFG